MIKNKNGYWWIQQNSNEFRSFRFKNRDISINDFVDQFRENTQMLGDWSPPKLVLYEDKEEETKPIGDFPTIAGTVPLVISKRALENLDDLISKSIEVLPLNSSVDRFYCLNIEIHDCLNKDQSEIKRFESSGRIMRVEHYEFIEEALCEIHLFRIPEEPLRRVFVSDTFKKRVEETGLQGLIFQHLE